MKNLTFVRTGLGLTTIALLLTACGGGSSQPAPPQQTEQSGVIQGHLTPTSLGSSVKPEELNVTAPTNPTNGAFSLSLPNVATMTSTYQSLLLGVPDVFGACTNPSTTAPAGLQLYPLAKLMTNTGVSVFATDATQGHYNAKNWWFSDRDVSFTFRGNCIGLGDINTTLNLKRGWNVLDVNYYGDHTTYAVIAQPDANTAWTAVSNVTGQGLHPNILEPWKNSAAYQRR